MVTHLSTIDDMAQNIKTMIPLQILTEVDNSRNPMLLTRERIERAATENQFMNGKIAAIDVSFSAAKAMIAIQSFYTVVSQLPQRSVSSEFPGA